MCVHFNTHQLAVDHLIANGWKECRTGRFVSRDGSCAAQISPRFDDVVLVQVWSI